MRITPKRCLTCLLVFLMALICLPMGAMAANVPDLNKAPGRHCYFGLQEPYEQSVGDAVSIGPLVQGPTIADAWTNHTALTCNEVTVTVEPVLTVSGKQVFGAFMGMTADEFVAALENQYEYTGITVSGKDGGDVRNEDVMATGMLVHATSPDGSAKELTVIVTGDVLGTGKMSLSQLVTLCGAYAGKTSLGEYLMAGDWSGDGTINLTDIVAAAGALVG